MIATMRTTLATRDPEGLAAAFNEVYAGYVMALTMTPEQALRHLEAGAINPERSPLWLDNQGSVQAMAALGVRERRGWIGGFGVAPAYRGRGLARSLLQQVIRVARDCELEQLELEVLTNNPVAIRVYEQAGFRRSGAPLLGLTRAATEPAVPEPLVDILEIDLEEALSFITQIRPTAPCWQREHGSVRIQPAPRALIVGERGSPGTVILYREVASRVMVVDLVTTSDDSAVLMSSQLPGHWPNRPLFLANEPEDSRICRALLNAGWTETWRQHRMILPLPADPDGTG